MSEPNIPQWLTNMIVPNLTDTNFSTSFEEFCEAIRDNIIKITSAPYIQGPAGSSIKVDTIIPTPGDNPKSSSLYNKLQELLGDTNFPALTTLSDEVNNKEYISIPYIYKSADPDDDKSCVILGSGEFDGDDWTWTLTSYDIFPTIYKKGEDYCWKINGIETGINARGKDGKNGTTPRFFITKGTYDDGWYVKITHVLDNGVSGPNWINDFDLTADDFVFIVFENGDNWGAMFGNVIVMSGESGVEYKVPYITNIDIINTLNSVNLKTLLSGVGVNNNAPRGLFIPANDNNSWMGWNDGKNLNIGKVQGVPASTQGVISVVQGNILYKNPVRFDGGISGQLKTSGITKQNDNSTSQLGLCCWVTIKPEYVESPDTNDTGFEVLFDVDVHMGYIGYAPQLQTSSTSSRDWWDPALYRAQHFTFKVWDANDTDISGPISKTSQQYTINYLGDEYTIYFDYRFVKTSTSSVSTVVNEISITSIHINNHIISIASGRSTTPFIKQGYNVIQGVQGVHRLGGFELIESGSNYKKITPIKVNGYSPATISKADVMFIFPDSVQDSTYTGANFNMHNLPNIYTKSTDLNSPDYEIVDLNMNGYSINTSNSVDVFYKNSSNIVVKSPITLKDIRIFPEGIVGYNPSEGTQSAVDYDNKYMNGGMVCSKYVVMAKKTNPTVTSFKLNLNMINDSEFEMNISGVVGEFNKNYYMGCYVIVGDEDQYQEKSLTVSGAGLLPETKLKISRSNDTYLYSGLTINPGKGITIFYKNNDVKEDIYGKIITVTNTNTNSIVKLNNQPIPVDGSKQISIDGNTINIITSSEFTPVS